MLQAIKIKGQRIYLRELSEADATVEYCAWLNDKKVNKHLETKQMELKKLKNYVREKKEKKDCIFLGIFLNKSDTHIGNIKLEPIDWEDKTATMGMMIGNKSYWGKGLATEALELLTEWAFKNIDMKTINLGVVGKNMAAIKVYEKAGFNKVKKTANGYKMEIKKQTKN
jgi:[ribosomal protein S5]-alanine N-acetyltransferase